MKVSFRKGTVIFAGILSAAVIPSFSPLGVAFAQTTPVPQRAVARDLFVTVGKSLIVDSPVEIERVSVADPKMAEAVVTSPRELILNGRMPGQTSLIVWQKGGNRLLFDLKVSQVAPDLDPIRRELSEELPGQQVTINVKDGYVFLRGTVNDLTSAQRAVQIVETSGKPVNLLRVKTPAAEAQILLKIKFATIDRSTSLQLGANLFSLGATNTIGSTTTQQYSSLPGFNFQGFSTKGNFNVPATVQNYTLSNALNLFLFRPDLDLGATIEALQQKSLAQILAEPNVLAMNGLAASFLAGGEFPYPTLQGGGGGLGAVTVSFREFGVRINFLPVITPRGTIKLDVAPEVSSLDYANGLTLNGFTIPGLDSRKVHTNIELQSGQSFAIAGLLDQRVTKQLSKIPGLGDIPLLGKLFQSMNLLKTNNELLIIVTPELVRPIPAGQPLPAIAMAVPFMKNMPQTPPRTPGMNVTGPVPVVPPQESVPVEQLLQTQQTSQSSPSQQAAPSIQFVPMLVPPQSTVPAPNPTPNGPSATVPPPSPANTAPPPTNQ